MYILDMILFCIVHYNLQEQEHAYVCFAEARVSSSSACTLMCIMCIALNFSEIQERNDISMECMVPQVLHERLAISD